MSPPNKQVPGPSSTVSPPPSGFDLGDLYYIVFRHKWKILAVFALGLIAAFGFYQAKPPMYESTAKILVRYIMNQGPIASAQTGSQSIAPDPRGEGIMVAQAEILASFDLAQEVAGLVGPEKILALTGKGTNQTQAAAVIRSGLLVDVTKRGSVISIAFRHPDATIVQPVLRQVVDSYLKRQAEIYQGAGTLEDFFARQSDQLRSRLTQTDEELRNKKAEAQIISIEDSKRGLAGQIARLTEELTAAETELVVGRANLKALSEAGAGLPVETNVAPPVPAELVERYRGVSADLLTLQSRLTEYRTRFTDQHFLVRTLSNQVAELKSQKLSLEAENAGLARAASALASSTAFVSKAPLDAAAEVLRVRGLEARVQFLQSQLGKVRKEAEGLVAAEPGIAQLELKKMTDQNNLNFYDQSLQRIRVDETMGAGKITNISMVQSPTPPARDLKELKKPLAGILAFAFFGGLAWALALEKLLDKTFKRAVDLERILPVPVFMTVPDFGWKSRPKASDPASRPNQASDLPTPANGAASAEVAPWNGDHALRPFYEGLRDRLITYFEVRNMNHKPKLIAVTGCARGAGVTTMAAGLAASLSETGDGNVLLVDMNAEQGAAHPFSQGKPCALAEALEGPSRDDARVQDNLYLVTANETNNQKLPRVLPRRFSNLVPKMKASDYDYIIFDMPPVTQTSVTARLSGFMDMVLMVVEAERTGKDSLLHAHGLLQDSRATVASVLNKHREYLPERISRAL